MSAAKCGAPTKQTKKPCRNPAGFKTDHVGTGTCHLHLGNSPSHIKAAEETQARAAAMRWGEPIVTTGVDALLRLLYHWAGIEAFYRARVQELSPEQMVWGMSKRKTFAAELIEDDRDEPRDPQEVEIAALPEVTEAAGVNIWVKLHAEASDKLADIAKRCVDVGIDERRIRLAERDGALLVTGLQWLAERLQVELRLSETKVVVLNGLVLEMLRRLDVTASEGVGRTPVLQGEVVQ